MSYCQRFESKFVTPIQYEIRQTVASHAATRHQSLSVSDARSSRTASNADGHMCIYEAICALYICTYVYRLQLYGRQMICR